MAEVIRMPRLSDTMEEGVIVEWLKKEGDPVEPGDILAEVETDKATMELENYHEGVLLHIGVKEGAVPVNGILAVIGEEGEDYAEALAQASKDAPAAAPVEVSASTSTDAGSASVGQTQEVPSNGESSSASVLATTDGRIKASPLAKKMAMDAGVELGQIKGSGEHGRVVKRDVLQYIESGASRASTPEVSASPAGVSEDLPVSQMRKVIARRLSESKFSAPHFYVTVEIEMSRAMEARKALNEEAPPKISFNDLIVKATAAALRRHPKINASWLGDRIRVHGDVHVGVAVAVEDGLMVPVVRHADRKSLSQINSEVKELAGRARERKLQPAEMQGNTFTISNLGMFGVDEFTAIINPPDACILAVGSIVPKPIVADGSIQVGNILKVTLSSDHRVVDGAMAAQFLQTLRSFLENPITLLR